MAERRAQLHALAREQGVLLGATGTHPWSELEGPADHRHAALPAEQRAAPVRGLAQQHLRAARPRRHQGRRPRDRGLQRDAAPPARAARAVGQLAVRRGGRHRPALGAHADLHAHVPALRDPGPLRRLAGLRGLRRASSTGRARSTSTRSSGGACGRTSPTRRSRSGSCDAQPDLAESQSLAALAYALAARSARAHDEGEPLPDLPHRLLEENMWRAIRHGLVGRADRLRPRRARARPARGSRR